MQNGTQWMDSSGAVWTVTEEATTGDPEEAVTMVGPGGTVLSQEEWRWEETMSPLTAEMETAFPVPGRRSSKETS